LTDFAKNSDHWYHYLVIDRQKGEAL
jgi:hypothetical protein